MQIYLDPLMPVLAGAALTVLLLGVVLRRLRQPYVVAYLLAGILLGPHALGVVKEPESLSRLGAIGVDLLLFFVGMEISPRRLLASWRVAVIGTLLQILVSVGCVLLLGWIFAWPYPRSILLGFVISLSSTAVVLKMLEERQQIDTPIGRSVVGILVAQDLALIPMLILCGLLGGAKPSLTELALQGAAGLGLLALVIWLSTREQIRLPIGRLVAHDREMQIFAAFAICLGAAFLTAMAGLSTALGAFFGGIVVGLARETEWVHRSLEPFRVVFVAFFFAGVGTLVDLDFLATHWEQVLLMLLAALLTNTLINSVILRAFGNGWRDSLYAGSLLAQIGEFSFVLAAVGFQTSVISEFGYQSTILIIALSLLVAPVWIGLGGRLRGRAVEGTRRVATS